MSPQWIAALSQTAGRGRRGRTWEDSTGNLYATAFFPVDAAASELAILSFTTALAVRETLEQLSRGVVQPSLKWPNDVRVDGAKLCGILLETGGSRQARWVSIGVGINLASVPDLPDYKAAALADLTGEVVTPKQALPVLDECLRGWLDRQIMFGRTAILDAWKSHAEGMGDGVSVTTGSEILTGIFDGIDESGQLLLRQADGTIKVVSAGDVELVRKVES